MKFEIWYMRPNYFAVYQLGGPAPNPKDLEDTHVLLKHLDIPDGEMTAQLEDIFHTMQGEVWSPNGEAKPLILSKGLRHTSMSVGDVVVTEDGTVFVVDMIGFKPLGKRS